MRNAWLRLYSLKMFLSRKQFAMSPQGAAGIRDLFIFCIKVHLRAWITAPVQSATPNNDINHKYFGLRTMEPGNLYGCTIKNTPITYEAISVKPRLWNIRHF